MNRCPDDIHDMIAEKILELRAKYDTILEAADAAIDIARGFCADHVKRVDGEERWCSACRLDDAIDRFDEVSEEYR